MNAWPAFVGGGDVGPQSKADRRRRARGALVAEVSNNLRWISRARTCRDCENYERGREGQPAQAGQNLVFVTSAGAGLGSKQCRRAGGPARGEDVNDVGLALRRKERVSAPQPASEFVIAVADGPTPMGAWADEHRFLQRQHHFARGAPHSHPVFLQRPPDRVSACFFQGRGSWVSEVVVVRKAWGASWVVAPSYVLCGDEGLGTQLLFNAY